MYGALTFAHVVPLRAKDGQPDDSRPFSEMLMEALGFFLVDARLVAMALGPRTCRPPATQRRDGAS
ncbi:hypothetical protein WQE_35390 [Paraburkholderia hospita]|uniref:Uncharacterized protein n=1 Tax=Paraburkholderia hospita TaxID=169430 RepID=A0ABN0FC01_9BURK|nr:hypothetical protein WQE_35390 [Paraburkholderia hospita]